MSSQHFLPHLVAEGWPAPAPLRIDISSPDPATVVVSPTGEADICTVSGLDRALRDVLDEDRARVVVDLDHLTFMDASTLGVLVGARGRATAAGKTLDVTCSTRHGRRLLTTTGLERLLQPST